MKFTKTLFQTLFLLGMHIMVSQQENSKGDVTSSGNEADLNINLLQQMNLFELNKLDEKDIDFTNRIHDVIALTTFGKGDITTELKDLRDRVDQLLFENESARNSGLNSGWLRHLGLPELKNQDLNANGFTDRIHDFQKLTTFGNGDLNSELRAFRQRINHLLYENDYVKNIDLNAGWLKHLRLYELRDLDEDDIHFIDRIHDFQKLTTFGNGDLNSELRAFRERINHMLYDNEFIKNTDLNAGVLKQLRLYELRDLDEDDIHFTDRIHDFQKLTTFGNGDLNSELRAFRERINHMLYDNEFIKNTDLNAGWLKQLRLYELRDLDENDIAFTDRIHDFQKLTTFGNGDLNSELKAFKKRINHMLYDNEFIKNTDLDAGWLKQLRLSELRDLDENDIGFTDRIEDFKKLTTFGEGDLNTELKGLQKRINTMLQTNKVTKEVLKKDGSLDTDKLKDMILNFSLDGSN